MKRDFLTSVALVARSVKAHRPSLIIADGQGALVTLGLVKPLLLESCLALRDVAVQEAVLIGRAWASVKAAVVTQPRLGRAMLEIDVLRQAVPELFEFGHPWAGPPCVAIESRYSPTHEQERALLKLLEVPVMTTLEDVLLKEYLGNPAPLMWDHGGKSVSYTHLTLPTKRIV